MTNLYRLAILILLAFISKNALALDMLELKTRTNYPKSMTTVYDAATYILEPYGYKVEITSRYAPDAYKISTKPITPLARTARTMSIYDALQALIGVENTIVVDHKNKLIAFMSGVHSNETLKKN